MRSKHLLKAQHLASRPTQVVSKEKNSWGRVGSGHEPTISCASEKRVGASGDGGKWLCDAYRIAQLQICNVMSIGSNNDWSFEIAVHQLNPLCNIYTFDHTITPAQKPDFVTFLPFGLSEMDEENLLTIPSAVQKIGLQGQKIDIFKIDCEGCEYALFNHTDFNLVHLQQIVVEIHAVARYKDKKGMYPISTTSIHKFFNTMAHNKYVIFHKEGNGGCCTEYSFIKLDLHEQEEGHMNWPCLRDGNVFTEISDCQDQL